METTHQIHEPCSLANLLNEARSSLIRLTPLELHEAQRSGAALVLDTRTPTDRFNLMMVRVRVIRVGVMHRVIVRD
jgi:hypothetical protein